MSYTYPARPIFNTGSPCREPLSGWLYQPSRHEDGALDPCPFSARRIGTIDGELVTGLGDRHTGAIPVDDPWGDVRRLGHRMAGADLVAQPVDRMRAP